MIYVLPTPPPLRGRLSEYSRLYAFPAVPEPPPDNGFVILDSGAFGLSQRGGTMTRAWMRKLAAHYEAHGRDKVICIAPDVYLDPAATMRNWSWWQQEIRIPVAPVIQFRAARKLDVYTVIKQARFYAPYKPPFVAVSNPGLRGVECRELMPQICHIVRQATGATWLHNLGAGWDMTDIRAWRHMACFDSIDSIAYYTAAQNGQAWQVSADTWQETAAFNGRVANTP